MKVLLVLAVLVAVTLAYNFPERNEHFDVESLVADREALRAFNGCFMETHPCTNVAAYFKVRVRDAVQTACTKCTPHQKIMFRQYLEGLNKQLPEEYKAFVYRYDPESKFFNNLLVGLYEDLVKDA